MEPLRVLNPVAHFGQVDGTLVHDADNVAVAVKVTASAGGPGSVCADFNEHLRSADFFDAAKWPTITFKSTKVEAGGDNKLKVTGDLTLRGVTKPVVLDVTLNKVGASRNGRPRIGFDATTTIQRSDFGIAKYAPNVSDEVAIRITTEALGPKADEAKADAVIVERPAGAARCPPAGCGASTRSFGHYYDPQWMGFAVRGDQRRPRAAGGEFLPHRHANMQILSVVVRRACASGRHRQRRRAAARRSAVDERGARDRAQRVQCVGRRARAFPADLDPAGRAQCDAGAGAVQAFDPEARRGRWATLASPGGVELGTGRIRQQAWCAVRWGATTVSLTLDPARRHWVHVATGEVDFDVTGHLAATRWACLPNRRAPRRAAATLPPRCCCSTPA